MFYKFTIDGLPVLQGGEFGPKIEIEFESEDPLRPLKQLSAFSSHKTLGVHKAPSSTNKGLFESLKKKNTQHTAIMHRSPFSPTDAWAYYHSIYLPSICYPFPSSTLSKQHCLKLQREFKVAFLPGFGMNRCTPNAVVYGAADYGGLALRDLSVECGNAQVYMFLATIRPCGVASDLATIMLSWGQFLAGTSKPILMDLQRRLPHMDPMQWLPAMRIFLQSVNCQIEVGLDFVPRLQRENDLFIMDHATASPFTDGELKLINACRIYLGATVLSDITTPDGTTLNKHCLQGQRSPYSTAKGLVPYHERPGPRAWQLWRRFLKTLTAAQSNALLASPLGSWTVTGNDTLRQWHAYFSPTHTLLYVLENDSYHVYAPTMLRRFISTGLTTTILPPHSVPAFTRAEPLGLRALFSWSHASPPVISPVPTTLQQHQEQLPKWERDLLKGISFIATPDTVLQCLKSTGPATITPIHLCSDGSAPLFRGSFGCICVTDTGVELYSLAGPAPGFRASSFRAESYGLLSLLQFLFRFCEYHGISLPPNLCLYTDFNSAIQTIHKRLDWVHDFPYTTMSPDWDLHQAITTALRRFPSLPTCQHVRGHQDSQAQVSTLSLPAQLNIRADFLASQYTYPEDISSTHAPLVTGAMAILHGPNGTINSNYRQVLRRLASDPEMTKYLSSRNDWSPSTFDSISWTAHASALRGQFPRRQFFAKYLHDWLPLGDKRSLYADHYPSTCPKCEQDILETREHFLRCPGRKWIGSLLDDLQTFCNTHFVDPVLQNLLRQLLLSWIAGTPPQISSLSPGYSVLLARQSTVGIEHLFYGRFVTDWIALQDAHLLQCPPTEKGHFHGSMFVTTCIKIIWEHVYRLRLSRNQDLHGHDNSTRESAALAQAQLEIQCLYRLRHSVDPRDRILFYSTLEEHFTTHTTSASLRSWIDTWQPVILKSVRSSRY